MQSALRTQRFLIVTEEMVRDGEVGKRYMGQWKLTGQRLVKDGLGVLTWSDGSSYRG